MNRLRTVRLVTGYAPALALALVLCAFSACSTGAGGVSLPPLPAWQEPADPTPLSAGLVVIRAQMEFPGIPVTVSDSTYTRVSRVWLDRYVSWTWEACKAGGVVYTPESFDCDDFAVGFYFFATRAAAKANAHAAPLVARIVVQWDATNRHELIGVVTDAGIVVVEPQPTAGPFRVWPLATYEKRILSITFGDFNP